MVSSQEVRAWLGISLAAGFCGASIQQLQSTFSPGASVELQGPLSYCIQNVVGLCISLGEEGLPDSSQRITHERVHASEMFEF